jgi:signal peptidase I
MLSLFILVHSLGALLLVNAWLLARAARWVGSPRGTLKFGLLAVLLLTIANLAIFATWQSMSGGLHDKHVVLAATFAYATGQLIVAYLIPRFVFGLSVKQAWAPFGMQFVIGIAAYGFAAGVLKPHLIEAFVIPTGGMSPTLDPGDRFAVNKLLRPRRWDMVAYHTTDEKPTIYCKRLIGLPGERLRFDGGNLHVDDQGTEAPDVLKGRLHAALPGVEPPLARYRDGETITLGKDEYFFIGDKVDVSKDSRFDGPTPGSSLVGVVDWIYWPLSKFRIVR